MHPKNQLIDQILKGLSNNYRKPNGDPIEISAVDRGNWMVTLQDISEEARFRECCEMAREQKAQWNPDPNQKLLEGPEKERYVPEEGELRRKLEELMTEVEEKKVKPQPKRYPFTVSMEDGSTMKIFYKIIDGIE